MSDKPTIVPKGRYQLRYRGTECLNCRHPLDMSDKYCPNCSQANSTKKLSFKDFFDEFFSSLISYDSKLLKTLSALLLKPGRITLDYVKGMRVSYTNPFRFMLSLGIIYFLMMSFTGNFKALNILGMDDDGDLPKLKPSSGFALSTDNKEQQDALKALDSMGFIDRIDASVKSRDSMIMHNPRVHFLSHKDSSLLDRYLHKNNFFQTVIRKDSIASFKNAEKKYRIQKSLENRAAFSTAASFIRVSREPGNFIGSLISKLPFATFFFLPVFALFISLAYIRKKYTYTDNLIFSFHNQSLLFILLIVSFLVDYTFNIDSSGVFLLVFLFYLYKAMRKFYKQGRFKTILKFVFLNTIFFILASVAALLLVLGSAFTY